jgi:hypothetical protein
MAFQAIHILFFFPSKISLIDLMQILYAFGIDQCMKLIPHLDEKTTMDWFNFFRDACSNALLRNPVKLGCNTGVDTNIVEIDESLFGKRKEI